MNKNKKWRKTLVTADIRHQENEVNGNNRRKFGHINKESK